MTIKPELNYNIAEMQLEGNIDGTQIYCKAYAGGRGGSKTPGAANPLIVNNPFLTGLKLDDRRKETSSGGPLPIGNYTLRYNPLKANWIDLVPENVLNIGNRGGFAIHAAHGPRGSDGCIAIDNLAILYQVCKVVKDRKEQNRPPVQVKVFATGDLDFYLRKFSTV